jgi:hypothetical protein
MATTQRLRVRLSEHVGDADALIEATFLDRDSAIARDYGHLTTTKATELAATSNVKQLVLTHISGRYPDEEILAETRIFPNSRVAADFDRSAWKTRSIVKQRPRCCASDRLRPSVCGGEGGYGGPTPGDLDRRSRHLGDFDRAVAGMADLDKTALFDLQINF